MPIYTRVLGTLSQEDMAEAIHTLSHKGCVDVLIVDKSDMLRRRLRSRTESGTEVVVALDRSEQLSDGAILSLEPEYALIVRTTEERWLSVEPRDQDAALEMGYFAGNLHWRVRFVPGAILIALEGPVETYLDRLTPLSADGKIKITLP
ncbi:MAG: urease accessory protein UreE [Alphaproteobacteria bacterium]|nr:urease accessory protein UreE [Alphaproteobacteria bacterium]